MRTVVVADLICAGRAVLRAAPDRRSAAAVRLVQQAEVADRFRAQCGTCHPQFGDGTLAAAARLAGLAPEPDVSDLHFAKALIAVLEALVCRAKGD